MAAGSLGQVSPAAEVPLLSSGWSATSGEIPGRLPFVVTVLTSPGDPEVARREGAGRRLFGFQD